MNVAKYIDHTQLKPDAGIDQIKKLCSEASEYGFFAVCTAPYFAGEAKGILTSSNVKVAGVVGFPMGYSSLKSKMEEIRSLGNKQVDEVDIVYNIAALKSGRREYVKREIRELTDLVHDQGQLIKVIFECGLLGDEEMEFLADCCIQASVDFMKTSTGFLSRGAALRDIELLRRFAGANPIRIKASGGISNREQAMAFIQAGADRLGCSKSVQIVTS